MKHRRGFTLIEMMVCIAGVGVVFLVSGRCCYHVFRQSRATAEFAEHHRQWQQLTDVFPRDVHAAREGTSAADGSTLTLTFENGRTIRYSQMKNRIERSETRTGKGLPPSAYQLWDGTTKWSVAADKQIATLTCQWYPLAAREALDAGQSPPPRELSLEAVIGSDHRFAEIATKR